MYTPNRDESGGGKSCCGKPSGGMVRGPGGDRFYDRKASGERGDQNE